MSITLWNMGLERTPDFDFVIVSSRNQKSPTRMEVNTANGTWRIVSAGVPGFLTTPNLRAHQTGQPALPFDSSIAGRCRCEGMRPAMVGWDGMQALDEGIQNDARKNEQVVHIPFTRLLLDSNLVSITDMVGYCDF